MASLDLHKGQPFLEKLLQELEPCCVLPRVHEIPPHVHEARPLMQADASRGINRAPQSHLETYTAQCIPVGKLHYFRATKPVSLPDLV